MSVAFAGIRPSWPLIPLGKLCDVSIGRTPARDRREYWGAGNSWLSIGDMNQGRDLTTTKETITHNAVRECNCRLVSPGTVVLSFKLSIGKVGIARIPLFTNEAIAALPIRDSKQLLPDYLYWALQSMDLSSGVDRAAKGLTLNKAKLIELGIPIPPLPEQRRIAAILDKADELRGKRRDVLVLLRTLPFAMFADLFGDYGKCHAWREVALGDVADVLTGFPFRSEEYVNAGDTVRLCRGANVLPGRLDWDDLARWPRSKTEKLAGFNLEPGDVVLAMDRPWISEGFKVAQVTEQDCPALLVQRVARLRGKRRIPNEFLFYLLNQPAFTRHCRPTETTVPHISPTDIRSFKFKLPPLELQMCFARQVNQLQRIASLANASFEKMDALFASLRYRAFRGEL